MPIIIGMVALLIIIIGAVRFITYKLTNKDISLFVSYDNFTKKYGYIDKTGQWIIEPQFEKAMNFSSHIKDSHVSYELLEKNFELDKDLAAVGIDTGKKDEYNNTIYRYRYIDKTGEMVIELDERIELYGEGEFVGLSCS